MFHQGFIRWVGALLCAVGLIYPAAYAQQSKVLTVAQQYDAQHLDPGIEIAQMSMNVYDNIFDPLLKRDENMVPQPWLATSVKALDNLTWEVKLRKGVTFQDGEPLNAEAVKFSIERIFDKDLHSILPTWLDGITKVDVVDDYTLLIHTAEPMPLMKQNLAMIYPVPPSYVKKVGNTQFNLHPIGTGPYKFEQWLKGDRIVLTAYKAYWGQKPYYDKLVFRFIPEDTSRVSALLSGQVDVIQGLPPALKDRVAKASGFDVRSAHTGRNQLLQLNVQDEQGCLQDGRVRQAIAYSIDTASLIKYVALGEGFELNTIVNPENFGYDPTIKPYSYNVEKAKQLLSEAGCSKFKFVINAKPDDVKLGEAIAGQLRQVGINASTKSVESNIFLSGWRGHTLGGQAFIVGLLSQTWDADGLLYLRFHCGEPMSYYCNKKLSQLVEDGRTTVDAQKRKEIYQEAQEILHEEMPIVPLYGITASYGIKSNIQWKPRVDGLMYMYEAKPLKLH